MSLDAQGFIDGEDFEEKGQFVGVLLAYILAHEHLILFDKL